MSGDGRKLIIAGGGLSGCLVALALARLRPEVDFLLVEQSQRFGGNHVWSFFDSDVAPEHRWLVEPFVAARWDGYDVRFPGRTRTLPTGYSSARSSLLDAHMRATLPPERYRLGAAADEESIVLDARGAGPADLAGLELGWQKFVGCEYRLAAPHGLSRPIVMDACVDQADGYRFVYCLPFAADRLLIEDTYYSDTPEVDEAHTYGNIQRYAAERGWQLAEPLAKEKGALPVPLRGTFVNIRPETGGFARIGLRGGFFHPTTGYSLPDAVRIALMIAARPDLSGAALAPLLSAESERLWRRRRFYRLLNRLLFRAAEPAERWRVLAHFHRLPAPVIERFYAGRSTLADKARILSGKPPVPLGRALKALFS